MLRDERRRVVEDRVAVLVFLALAVIGLTSNDAQTDSAVLALVLLLLATVLAVYKPRGRTRYAIRTRPTASSAAAPQR
ncbi:hypothetical protein [Nonomuraea sp. NPDC049480]|uniref:hypothetical protein n=1 Tax=Nonomuraea sp. NPDC049480 TaxID=3364353 RepID=UPI0037AA0696